MKKENVFILVAFMIIAFGLVTLFISSTSTGKEAVGYSRANTCILSFTANARTASHIDRCYAIVEKELHIKLNRYHFKD